MIRKWYRWLQEKLLPAQGLVKGILILIILVSLYLLFRGDSVKRTAWTAYLISP